jgi:hypothetical protein
MLTLLDRDWERLNSSHHNEHFAPPLLIGKTNKLYYRDNNFYGPLKIVLVHQKYEETIMHQTPLLQFERLLSFRSSKECLPLASQDK